jgi:ATP-dependent Clp protease protease subunit
VLLHQPHGGIEGRSEDIRIHAGEIVRQRHRREELLARHTGRTVERVHEDLDRDVILTPDDAIVYGVIDHVGARTPP